MLSKGVYSIRLDLSQASIGIHNDQPKLVRTSHRCCKKIINWICNIIDKINNVTNWGFESKYQTNALFQIWLELVRFIYNIKIGFLVR